MFNCYYYCYKRGIKIGKKTYSDEELITELHRFVEENGRVPTANDMNNSAGYISKKQYITRFRTWSNALRSSGLSDKVDYNNENVISMLQNFKNKYNRNPTAPDTYLTPDLPSLSVIIRLFGTFNKALTASGLEINKTQIILTGNETCDFCGTMETEHWNNVDTFRICDKCNRNKRDFIHGVLDPYSSTGLGYISEYVVADNINDNIWYNANINTFNTAYDMYSEEYGYISVKSSTLHYYVETNSSSWQFSVTKANKIPNNYIFVGFDDDRSDITHVWIIPSGIELIQGKQTIRISNSDIGLSRFKLYEVDATNFNTTYINMDLTSLFPFRNLHKQEGDRTCECL
ncbi:MAG: hypothetical protein M0P99_03710 [Candidatus Cloacimonetes bacterium]|nr:hypothetical protein [Candidatus Cloacimonadota bacterium]